MDGREYLDYLGSWGPLILGHAREEIVAALREALEFGTSFGAPTQTEVELAREVVEAVPSVEKVRMVNSGTEATLSALRLADDPVLRCIVPKTGSGDSAWTRLRENHALLGSCGDTTLVFRSAPMIVPPVMCVVW